MRRLILTSLSPAPLFGTLTALLLIATPAFAQAPASPLRMAGYPAPGAPPVVTLLTPGTNPGPPIRLGPTAIRTDHMDVTVKMGLAMEAGGMQMPTVDIPAMKVGMDFTVTEVKPNGEATVTMAMTGMSLMGPSPDPSFEEIMKTTNEQLKLVKGTMTVNARGQLVSNDFKFPSLAGGGSMDSLKSSLEDSIKNIAPPMPDGPLGLGARWEVRQAVSSGGIVMFQKTVNEITALDQDSVTVKSTLEQTSPAQAMNPPGMPPGAEMRIESGTATGSGTTTLRFGQLVPASEVNLKLAFKMMMSMNGESVPMSMTMTVATTLAGAPIK